MSRMRIILVIASLALSVMLSGQDFTAILSPSERAAAGLDRLTPAELTALKAAVERYKAGEVAVARQQAEQKVAEIEAQAAEKVREERKRGYFAALFNPGETEYTVESTLPGRHRSFRGKPVLTLANGQRWIVSDPVNFFAVRELQDPAVRVEPGSMGSFWMSIEGGPRLRVSPLAEGRRNR
jgi:hypothetical protein